MGKSKFSKKAISIIMLVVFSLMAVPQVLIAAEPIAYALNGTIGSLETLVDDDVVWNKVDTNGTIMIQPRDNAAGAAYSAYKLLNIEKDSGVLKVSIPDDAQPFWKTYLSSATNVTVGDIKNHIKDMGDAVASSSMVETFVGLDPSSKPHPQASASIDGSKATISATFGFYIVQQTEAPDNGYISSAPVLACLPMQKTAGGTWLSSYTAIPKDDKIKVSKKVKAPGDANYIKETIAEIGETLEYRIVADIAKYGADITSGTIIYNLVDTLPPGIKYKNNSAVLKFYKGSTVDTPSGSYTVKYNESTRKLTLDLSSGYAVNLADYDEVEITYQATLESNAIIEGSGNENPVVLTYTYTSATNDTKTYETSAKVYTHELDITKVDLDHPDTALTGAVFQVYRTEAEANNPDNAIKFIDLSGNPGYENGHHYRVATSEDIDTGATTTINIAVADTPAGKMNIYGLNDVTYYFKETVAPTGYNLPKDLFPISPAPDTGEKTVGEEITYHDMVAKTEKITNDSGINLPVTGGMGTILFTAIGLLLMAGAVYFLFGKKKDSN